MSSQQMGPALDPSGAPVPGTRLERIRLAGGPTLVVARSEHRSASQRLMALHGLHGAKEDLTARIPALAAAGWEVAVPDQRGHGASDQPPAVEDYSLERFAADVIALADALGWDRFTLFGTSMGGIVAQLVAFAVPRRLSCLVLSCTSPGQVNDVLDAEAAAAAADFVAEHGQAALADRAMASRGDEEFDTPASARMLRTPGWADFEDRKLRGAAAAMTVAMYRELFACGTFDDRLAALEVPTHVIIGEEDAIFRPGSERIASLVPGAVLHVAADAGHHPHHEAPEWWEATMVDILGS